MFSGCILLESLNISKFITSSINNMQHIFYNCKSLISLNLANFDTKSVNNI